MAMPQTDPRPEAERLKAFELFCTASAEGKVRSNRSIAAAIGVSPMTVGRWREVDKWDEKVNALLAEAATGAETTTNALKRRVRQGLLDGLSQLQYITLNAESDKDKIAAVKALMEIALKMDAVTAAALPGSGAKRETPEFDDNLPEDQKWPTTERLSKPDGSVDAVDALLSPWELPSPLPSPEEALELLQADEMVEGDLTLESSFVLESAPPKPEPVVS